MSAAWRILGSILFATILKAQPQTDLLRAAQSPYDLAKYAESHDQIDWSPLWAAWKINEPTHLRPCGTDPTNRCAAEILALVNPNQTILLLQSSELTFHDIYLRYRQQQDGSWSFAGEYHAFIKQFPRRHEVVRLWNKPFLKVSHDESQIGAGYTQEVEEWFDLTQPDFEPVFSFTVQGSEQRFSMGVGRSLNALAIPLVQNPEEIILDLNVTFLGSGLELPANYSGTYSRKPGEKKFTLRSASVDPTRTALATGAFEALAGIFELTNEQLLVYALPGLRKIATSTNPEDKEWLKQVLEEAKDTPEKRELEKLLAPKR